MAQLACLADASAGTGERLAFVRAISPGRLRPHVPPSVSLRSRMVAVRREREASSASVRLATVGVLGLTVLLPAIEVSRIASAAGPLVPALIATGCFLPVQLRHVALALAGSRPAGDRWTLGWIGLVIIAATPLVGVGWLLMFASLTLSVLIVVRPPWSFLVGLGVTGATVPLALALGEPGWSAAYFPLTVAWRSATLFVLVSLVAAARQLQTARLVLADEAVVRERLRIEAELRTTVAKSLQTIVERGDRASQLAQPDASGAQNQLRVLVAGSRRTLAEVRRISGSYQHASLRTELSTATTLLEAARVRTHLVLPSGDFCEDVDDRMRSTLHAATARLLSDGGVERCTITITSQNGLLGLDVDYGRRGRATTRVTA